MKMKIKVRSWLAVEVAVLFGMMMTVDAVAQQAGVPAQRPAVVAKAASKAQRRPAGGNSLHQGIAVHGHWVMNVLDEQGKVVEHRDFENAVVYTGQTVLTSLLIGAVTPGYLNVAAYGAQGTASGPHFDGEIYEVNFPQFNHCNYASDEVCTSNLVVTPVIATDSSSGSQYYSGLSLEGTFKPTVAVVLNAVGTSALMCRAAVGAVGTGPVATRSTYAPKDCPAHVSQAIFSDGFSSDGSAEYYRLTGTSITPLSVAAGQTLDITVTLSFS